MQVERFFTTFNTAAKGLEAQRQAMGAAAENIANINTTRTADGSPYQIKRAVHEAPNTKYSNFYNLLNKMQSRMDEGNASHRSGSSLRRLLDKGQMGPETSIEELDNYRLAYEPSHPHADENGYVQYPDVNTVDEMSRMVSASRLYQANLTALDASKNMIKNTLKI